MRRNWPAMWLVAVVVTGGCSAGDEADPGPGVGVRDAGTPRDAGRSDVVRADVAARDAPGVGDGQGDGPARGDGAEGGVASREVCNNGLDDDGDGTIDENCPCEPGTSQRCYPRPAEEIGRGPCAWGMQGCLGTAGGEFGRWTECVGAVTPTEDVCGDGMDQDCNGRPDDGPRCACTPGATRSCYTGRMGTEGVGICRAGMQTCESTGMAWGTCVDQVLPRAELCSNRLDDDCNGVVDDGPMCACPPGTTRECYSGPRAEVGVGICRAGRQICNVSGTSWGPCMGEVGPMMEVCGNMLDDDCDGMPDDGCPAMRECNVTVNLDGDCLTVRCPAECPFPVGCNITMAGNDPRGCVASRSDAPVVYFQEGDRCGAGRVTGTLRCSNVRGAGLNMSNCMINKPTRIYPPDRSGCPRT